MDKYLVIGILIFTVVISKTYGTEEVELENGQVLTNRATAVPQACGNSSSYKDILMVGSVMVAGKKCVYTILPYSSYVCQIRIDINLLYMNQPDPSGKCSDKLLIKPLDDFALCGTMANSHVYVPLNDTKDYVEIEFSISGNGIGIWNLTATQLQCPMGSPRMLVDNMPQTNERSLSTTRALFTDGYLIAPTGCLQYYPDPTGVVESFNYNNGIGPYPVNMDYAICFRRDADDTKLTLVGKIEMSQEGPDPFDEDCYTSFPIPGGKEDYLSIPESRTTNGNRHTRYCGNQTPVTIESRQRGPLVIYFHSDGQHDEIREKGFHLKYSIT